jgi:serine/threonine protein phosphatase PrpC
MDLGTVRAPEGEVCPACHEPVPSDADYCEACGTELAAPVTGLGETQAIRVCVQCGAVDVDATDYCQECGRRQPRERDHLEADLGLVAAVSDRGRHHHRNEDAMAISHVTAPDGAPAAIIVVCDGVSSANRPDEGSLAAAEIAARYLAGAVRHPAAADPATLIEIMGETVREAGRAVAALALPEDGYAAPACTIVAALVTSESVLVGWIGDSRAYWLDAHGGSVRLTVDDTLTDWLVADGRMTEPEPHVVTFAPTAPGVVLACSDGLWNYLWDASALANVAMPRAAADPLGAARTLVAYALEAGGRDNITVALASLTTPAGNVGTEI